MSRKSVSNVRYTLAFGVDRTPMGTFVQVFDKTWKDNNEYDSPIVEVDALFGIQVYNQDLVDANEQLSSVVKMLEDDFSKYKLEHKEYPNLAENDIICVAKSLNLCDDNLPKTIHELWD